MPSYTKKRLGKPNDGGYVIPIEVLKDIEAVVVFGINDEDSFEQELAQYIDPTKVPFYLCDPFAQYTKKTPFTFLPLGLGSKTEDKFITLPDFLKRYKLEGKKIFLKMDIEGAEWPSLEFFKPSDYENIVCLLIEFHGLLDSKDIDLKFRTLYYLNQSFTLLHCHQNNHGLFSLNNSYILPDVVECTYINTLYHKKNNIDTHKRTEPFPSEIDQPNTTEKSDYPIYWWISNLQTVYKPINT